ncbi:MAG: hypothetical protein ACREDE_09095 [Thermoplasmata archaeon]
MPGILETILARTRHQTAGAGGLLSGLGGGGGILSTHVGITQSRLATAQAATGGPVAKIQAIMSSASVGLGAHLRAGAGGLMGKTPLGTTPTSAGSTPPATDALYQTSSTGRIYGVPTAPAGISYK